MYHRYHHLTDEETDTQPGAPGLEFQLRPSGSRIQVRLAPDTEQSAQWTLPCMELSLEQRLWLHAPPAPLQSLPRSFRLHPGGKRGQYQTPLGTPHSARPREAF